MFYRMVLFSVTLSDPNGCKLPHFQHFVSPVISSQRVEIETLNLVSRLIVAITNPQLTNHP